MVQPLWKTVWRVLKKLKIELPYDLAIPLLAILSRKDEKSNLKRYMHPKVQSRTIRHGNNPSAHQQMIGLKIGRASCRERV